MTEKQKVFTEFIEEFVKLDVDQKNSEIIESQVEILNLLLNYAESNGIQYEFLKSKEINDIVLKSGTDEDYLEAMMVYNENIRELIGTIFNKV